MATRKDYSPTPAELIADMNAHVRSEASAEVVPVDSDSVVLPRSYGLSFADLAAGRHDTIEGFDLVKGENKHTLIGVPFIIVGVTYRPGIAAEGQKANYVSVELVTADKPTMDDRLKNKRITDRDDNVLTEALVGCDETLVINDGGTGIPRQITEYLHLMGVISVGAITSDTFTGGPAGESPYDRYFEDWPMGGDRAAKGIRADLKGTPLRLYCPRGLRVSRYPNPRNNKVDSYTYYFG